MEEELYYNFLKWFLDEGYQYTEFINKSLCVKEYMNFIAGISQANNPPLYGNKY